MNRLYACTGLVALSVGLGGCFVAAPVHEPYYGYSSDCDRPAVVVERPYFAWGGPRIERHYVIENDRVIRHSRPYYKRADRHRRWYDNDDHRRRHDDD